MIMILVQNIFSMPNPMCFLLFLGARVVKRQAVLCKVPKVCQIWCRISGHSNGVCDETDDCLCSGESVEKHFCSDEHYNEDEQHTICAGFCQFKGKQTGTLIFLKNKSTFEFSRVFST